MYLFVPRLRMPEVLGGDGYGRLESQASYASSSADFDTRHP